MFDRLKRGFGEMRERAAEYAANGPADLAAVPAVGPGGLPAVDLDVARAYLGLPLESVAPLSQTGPEATSFLGARLQERLRAMGADEAGPGELFAGHAAAREQRMREQGMSEEQIALIRQRMSEVVAEHQASGWTLTFANGTHASVQVFPTGSQESRFETLRDAYRRQFTRAEMEYQHEHLFATRIEDVPGAPYESYYEGGGVSARGQHHEVVVKSNTLVSNQLKQCLAAIAALALRSLGN